MPIGSTAVLLVLGSVLNLEQWLISLGVFIAMAVCSIVIIAWALARSALAVGSPRGRFRVGLLAAVIIAAVGWAFTVIGALASSALPMPPLLTSLTLLLIELVVIFLNLRAIFKLTVGRTFAPFGAFFAASIAEVVLALLLVRPFVVEAFVIPTGSMSPTLKPGDRISVNKVTIPRRFDLVTYWATGTPPPVYAKRVIGLPGERLRFDGGGLFVDDEPVALPPVLAGRCHASPPGVRARYHDGETITLGKAEYFMIGDNVDLSFDSRFSGPSRGTSIIGVADLIYWPEGRMRIIR
jgi:signal peptidase I